MQGRSAQPVLVQLVDQRSPRQAHAPGGARLVAAFGVQRFLNAAALHVFELAADRAGRAGLRAVPFADVLGQMARLDGA